METHILDIPVLWPDYFEDCEQCIERLRESLQGLDGMKSVTINADHRTVEVSYDKNIINFDDIKDHARLVGVQVAEKFKHEIVRITGLDCPDCSLKLETAINRMNGVVWATLNFATSVLTVEYEPEKTSLDAIKNRIKEFGYDVEPEKPTAPEVQRAKSLKNMRLALTATSGLLLILGIILQWLKFHNASTPLLLASAIMGGFFAARTGFFSLKEKSLDTNFLMTAAAVGAIALGDFSEAAAVMFLYSLGSTLESYTVDRTRRSIKKLVESFPSHASVKRHGEIQEVGLEDIEIGDIVIIRPGDNIPVDGTIVSGSTSVNEAPITGESVPRDKSEGDHVYAGSINGRGALEVRVTSSADDNTLSRIVHLVEEAQAQKAPSQRFSEKFGKVYTPIVISLAVLVGIFGPLVFGGGYRDWIVRSLTLLVVSCPCALVISTPVAIVAAIGNAAKSGILIKGGAHLERLGDVSIVAFDKTGTLTLGKLQICDVIPFNSHSTEEILSVAAAAESRSEHPLADAIINRAKEMGLPERNVSFFEAFPGKGARAVVDGEVFYIGSKRLIEELDIETPGSTAIAGLLIKGCTVVYLADQNMLWGAIGASDTVKENTTEAIIKLKDTGIQKTVMLTGDTAQTGRAVAKQVGIDKEYAELLPEDKLVKIKELSAGKDTVAMVGDGINDAPALAAADVGIAMGGVGSPAAVEASDVTLMADDIVMLPYAISLSRKARRIIIQNVSFAVAAVVVLVSSALLKKITLATGVIGHEGSALLVIANSMRLLKRSK